jgi:transcriptional regulator with XRE-family HTH domain
MGRLWLLAALSTWRQLQGVSLGHVAAGLGMTVDAVRRWELESPDPVLKRAMATARLCGTRLTMSLWERPDWTFG